MTTTIQLTDLVEGDLVIFSTKNSSKKCKIKRVTATQIIIDVENLMGTAHERRFNKNNGNEVGGSRSYSNPTICPYTDEYWELELQDRKYKIVFSILRIPKSDTEKIKRAYDFLLSEELINPIDTE